VTGDLGCLLALESGRYRQEPALVAREQILAVLEPVEVNVVHRRGAREDVSSAATLLGRVAVIPTHMLFVSCEKRVAKQRENCGMT
jgi:hypothetical protein